MQTLLEKPVDLPAEELNISGIDHATFSVAHPDDESMLEATVRRMLAHGVEVDAIIATDGEMSDRGDPNELRAGIRLAEADAAFSALGISQSNRNYANLPDAGILTWPHLRRLAAITFDVLVERQSDALFTLGHQGFDGHFDHIGGHIAGLLAARRYSAINPNIRVFGVVRQGGEFYTEADPEHKLRLLAHHTTQFGIDVSNPHYQPTPDTIELPGIHVPTRSRQLLEPYRDNMQFEQFKQYL